MKCLRINMGSGERVSGSQRVSLLSVDGGEQELPEESLCRGSGVDFYL